MDYEFLVKAQVVEGAVLIAELTSENIIDVDVALWVKRFGVGYWSFYIGSEWLASNERSHAFPIIISCMDRIQPKAIGLSDINLVLPAESPAAEAIELRDGWPHHLPRWEYQPGTFSDSSIQAAYIYPVVKRRMNPKQVIQAVAAVMTRPGPPTPSSITLRDGSSIEAVPTSIQRSEPGGLRIVLQDPAGKTERTVSADEVLSIR